MGRNISLFNSYHGEENTVSNYCGLMMKLVYQESPSLFNKLLEILFAGEKDIPQVGPSFLQQSKGKKDDKKNSIPDLNIVQNSFQILVETKLTDWFYVEQLERHTQQFQDTENKILVLLCNFEAKDAVQERDKFKKECAIKNVNVVELTFENLLNALSEVCTTTLLQDYLAEFRSFMDSKNLLPVWKQMLDVVNCGVTKNEVLQGNVYMCPNQGGQYSHKRAKYFGTYWDKKVEHVYLIDAVVSVGVDYSDPQIEWNNSCHTDEEVIKRALLEVSHYRSNEIKRHGLRVFLLSEPRAVDFRKDSRGGMYGSKQYFQIDGCNNIDELCERINGKKWSDF